MLSLLDIIRNTLMYIGIYRVLVIVLLHVYEHSHEKPPVITKKDDIIFFLIALLIWFFIKI